jgi:hypothetical protein
MFHASLFRDLANDRAINHNALVNALYQPLKALDIPLVFALQGLIDHGS